MCNTIVQADGTFRAWARWGMPGELAEGEISIELPECPDFVGERWDGQVVRPATEEELAASDAAQQQVQLEGAMACPEIQAILALMAEQAGTDLATVQVQAIAALARQVAPVVKKAL